MPQQPASQRLDVDAHPLEQLVLRVDAAGRLVVAVPVEDAFRSSARRLERRCCCEELGEVVRLLREPLRVLVVRAAASELVLEDGDAARLDPDDRGARADLVAQRVEHALEVALGEVEEAVVVERPPAADVALPA